MSKYLLGQKLLSELRTCPVRPQLPCIALDAFPAETLLLDTGRRRGDLLHLLASAERVVACTDYKAGRCDVGAAFAAFLLEIAGEVTAGGNARRRRAPAKDAAWPPWRSA